MKILKKLPEIILLVLLLTFVAMRSDKVLCKNKTILGDSSKFNIEDARCFFPQADRFLEEKIDMAWVLGKDGIKIGKLLCTSPVGDNIYGYAGTTPVLIAIDGGDVIKGIKLMPNMESRGFVKRICKKGFFNSWDNISIVDALKKDVDVVSGASMTSGAVKDNINLCLEKYLKVGSTSRDVDYFKWLGFFMSIMLVVFALASFKYSAVFGKYRWLLLVLSVLILGFWQGEFISLALLYGWLIGGLSVSSKVIMVSIVLLAVILPFFTGKAFYCSYLCPFGASQELLGKLCKKKLKLPVKMLKYLKYIRMVFFYILLFLLLIGIEIDLTEFEPFSAFLCNVASPEVIILATVFLILSIFIPKVWCNYFCPTGYLLDVFRKAKKIK